MNNWTCKCGVVHLTGTYCGKCDQYAPGVEPSSPPPESGKTLGEIYRHGRRDTLVLAGVSSPQYEKIRHEAGLAAVAAESVKLEQSAHLETKKRLIQSDDDCVALHDEIASLKQELQESNETKSVAIKEVARLSRELGVQDGVVAGLRGALEECEITFRNYANGHFGKLTPDGNRKGHENRKKAEMCATALRSTNPSPENNKS